VPAISGRTRSRHGVRSITQGPAGEHFPKIMAVLVAAMTAVVAVLATTAVGREIDAATQRFMLYYAGVFALVGLTASVGMGLAATDRIVMSPGHRVMAQALHRAVSFGALAFLVIHIVTEILAQRAHVIDAVIPFLSPFRTFYIGLGTIASDLIVLIVVTSILRRRFTVHGKAWRWRAIHYMSYAAFVFGVLHGLLAGRAAKPYVDWSYGFAIALTALGLLVRFLASSLRPKEGLGAPPGADRRAGTAGTSPLRAAALSVAAAQLGGTVRVLPAGTGTPGPGRAPAELPAAGRPPSSSFPAIGSPPAHAAHSSVPGPDFLPLGAPPDADRPVAGIESHARAAGRARPAPAGRDALRQPLYEPGYDGPPRYVGAPRRDVPPGGPSSYPYGPSSSRQPAQLARPGQDDRNTGPLPRAGTGPLPRADGARVAGPGTGPLPRSGTGPLPRASAGPVPRAGSPAGPRTGPKHGSGTGPVRRPGPAGRYRDAPGRGGGDEWR
jgi:DMSO/TMAO reductase YedYZ heme-binding membrane subunit